MPTIAAWCTVSPQEYSLLRHTMCGLLAHEAVATVLVVHTGVRPAPAAGALAARFDKVREVHRDFGEGYDQAIEEGGYDQCSARNYALDLVEETAAEWLVQVDADEFFSPPLMSRVGALADQIDAVCCSRYTLTSPRHYWCEPSLIRSVNGVRMLNPQIRIWRSTLRKRFDLCPIASRRYRNITRHCGVRFDQHPHWRVSVISDPLLHVHFHRMLGKRHATRSVPSSPLPAPHSPALERCIRDLTCAREVNDSSPDSACP